MARSWQYWLRTFGEALGGGRGPRHRGTLAATAPVTSPLNGLKAIYLQYEFFVRYTVTTHNRKERVVYEDVGVAAYGGPLVVQTEQGSVLVPEGGFEVRFSELTQDGLPVDGPLPPDLAHFMREPAVRRAPLCYRQQSLSAGDAVELRARLTPTRGVSGGGPYRNDGGYDCDFVARGERGRPALVIDHSVTNDL